MDIKHQSKGVSPLISTVIVIALVFVIAAVITPFAFNTATDVSNQTSHDVLDTINCKNMAYDFVTSFGTDGVSWNLTGSSTLVEARIINTGTKNVYTFSFELVVNGTSGLQILQYGTNSTYQKTASSPLRPGESAILRANISDDLNGTLNEVKIRNSVCSNVFVKQIL